MILADLIKDAARRLKRIERTLAFDLLRGDDWRADRRRYRAFSKVPVADYIRAGEEVELHRSVMPQKNTWEDGAPYPWPEWSRLTVDRIGPDCVRVFVPLRGSRPMPLGDFVRGVVRGHIREPLNTPSGAPVEASSHDAQSAQ